MKTACALLATFNEADIVLETVSKLISSGVEVYVIDNGSTDRTLEILGPLVGRGIVDIRTVKFFEGDREVYNWGALLKMKEDLSRELGFDWYLHVDADEIRYSPWPQLSLREGIDRVDQSGYNLINFKLFNFRLTEDLTSSVDYETDMQNYSAGEYFNQYQVKAWKAHHAVDISANGGHIARRPDGRLFPIRFIHKHFPIRSLDHGRRKILLERKLRFTQSERLRGWHVQYNDAEAVDAQEVFWSKNNLVRFDMQRECMSLLEEGADMACNMLSLMDIENMESEIEGALIDRHAKSSSAFGHAKELFSVAHRIFTLSRNGVVPPIRASGSDIEFLQAALRMLAVQHWLLGDATVFQRIETVDFQSAWDDR
jgi:hypothetical protein